LLVLLRKHKIDYPHARLVKIFILMKKYTPNVEQQVATLVL
jgi:hypothetical protein